MALRTAALRKPRPLNARGVSATLPAPVGGWNARDALSEMPANDAVSLDNWFPSTTSVNLRNGHSRWSTGISGQVQTILAYNGGSTSKLFAIADSGNVYDCTSGGAVGAAALSSLTNAKWQYINVATAGGNFIEMCNGADGVYTFDGTTWTDRSASITGVSAANLIGINLHKNRVWFVEAGTLKAWYLPTQSVQGAANALDLSSFCNRGGFLMAMATWTVDAGYGVDDLAVFITSEGEILVYRGTDPSSATTWSLVGVWWIGSPVGRRCFVKYQGDVLIICQDGVLPLSGALQSSRVQPQVALSYKIQQAVSSAVTTYGSIYGWQLLPFPGANMLILNVPIQSGNNQVQYVMNTITKSWCSFSGWNANCWELYGDEPYFGGNGYLAKAWSGTTDNGSNIEAAALQAFNYFGDKGLLKRWTMMRPIFSATGSPALAAGVNVDFDTSDTTAPLSFSGSPGSAWDSATWDGLTSLWQGANILKNWQGVTGVGYCAAPNITIAASNITVQWMSTDLVMQVGAIL